MFDICWGEVGQITVLGMAPDVFRRVEIGSIGRKPFDDNARMPGQPGRDSLSPVRAVTIPDEGEAMRNVAVEHAKEPQYFGSTDVVAMVHPVKTVSTPAWSHGEGADDREPIPTIPLSQDRGLAPRRPRPATQRLKHESALIPEHDASTGAASVFLYAASAPPAIVEWPPRFALVPAAPVSGNSTPRGEGLSRHGQGDR